MINGFGIKAVFNEDRAVGSSSKMEPGPCHLCGFCEGNLKKCENDVGMNIGWWLLHQQKRGKNVWILYV